MRQATRIEKLEQAVGYCPRCKRSGNERHVDAEEAARIATVIDSFTDDERAILERLAQAIGPNAPCLAEVVA